MDEDDFDCRTPIGGVIKRINTLCKKPQIDDQLSEALELFKKKLDEQDKYLVNGIFLTNFVEAALFLQGSVELYGKKVDLLWDQLLEFHTRLVQYDFDHQKQKGADVSKEVIEKLEERRNRYKRKKTFKIVQTSESERSINFIFDKEKEAKGSNHQKNEFEKDSRQMWKDFQRKSNEMRKIPNVIYKQMIQYYMLKNYYVMKSQDFDILDQEDEEFNTKYSRIPGWHHINHLFEYNDKGLLPDKRNIISKLRLTAYERIKFLFDKKIPYNTPYENYKEDYLVYREKFFAEEAKKWQNMPLDTFEDLHAQLQYLIQKEREELGRVSNERNNKLRRNSVKDVNRDDKIVILDNSDEDSLFELSFACSRDFMATDLFIRLEKLSSEIINTKLRQDSGFYEFNSDDNDDSDITSIINAENAEGVTENDNAVFNNHDVHDNGSVAPNVEASADNVGQNAVAEDASIQNGEETNAQTNATENVILKDTALVTADDSITKNISAEHETNTDISTNENIDNLETRSHISDHDYCMTIQSVLEPTADKCVEDNKESKNSQKKISSSGEVFDKSLCCGNSRIVPKLVKERPVKVERKLKVMKENGNNEVVPKRRKLSQKQIDKLLQIKTVKAKKFEKFFSLNYQPQLGEGDILSFDYESDISDSEHYDFDSAPLESRQNEDHPISLDRTDAMSVLSDHDYCQPVTPTPCNDSGFVDSSTLNVLASIEEEEIPEPENNPLIETATQCTQDNSTNETSLTVEDEFLSLTDKGDNLSRNELLEPTMNITQSEKERKESKARVEEWRNTITPILKNLKENEFDIHEYGSRIMEGMEVDESKKFSYFVDGKSSAEVVRYFISSLQLANTNNIEICGVKQGQLSNDTFNLKLLTKERYHEHLNEYLAPSEETFREKLDRVRAMNDNSEANLDKSKPKKLKLSAANEGKRTSRINVKSKHSANGKVKDICNVSELNNNTDIQPSTSKVASLQTSVVHNKQCINLTSVHTLSPKNLLNTKTASEVVRSHNTIVKTQYTNQFAMQKLPIRKPDVQQSESVTMNIDYNNHENINKPVSYNNNSAPNTFEQPEGNMLDIQKHTNQQFTSQSSVKDVRSSGLLQQRIVKLQQQPMKYVFQQLQNRTGCVPMTHSKGKNIAKPQIVREEKLSEPYILNNMISMPSTDNVVWSDPSTYRYIRTDHRSISNETPSTSYDVITRSPSFNSPYSPNSYAPSTSPGVSPNKRRRTSEESFQNNLLIVLEKNPAVQLQSTPVGPPAIKRMKGSMLKR